MIMKTLKLLIAVVSLSLLSACGGGGGGGGGGTTPVSDPKITVYTTYELASAYVTGLGGSQNGQGVLQTCVTNTNQLDIIADLISIYGQVTERKRAVITGNFNLPNGGICNTAGISGQITGITFTLNGTAIYSITSLSIDASTLTNGYKAFWSSVLAQTGKVINVTTNSSRITCTDSAQKPWYTPLTANTDIANFFATCIK